MKKIKIEFSNERIIPAGGLSVVGAILGKSDFAKKCNRMDVPPNRSQHQIKNGDILLTYIGMLCMGKPAFDSVHEFEDDPEFYQYALGITHKIPSEETLRQRMDDIGSSLRQQILAANLEMLQSNGIVPSTLPSGFVPLDWCSVKKKAIIAIARMILTSIYHMLSDNEDFHPDDYEATVNPPKQKPVLLTLHSTLQFLREQGANPEILKLIQQQCSTQAG